MQLIESSISQKRTFCFCDNENNGCCKAEIVFKSYNNEWQFVKCDYRVTSGEYSFQDWEFIGLVANKIKELNEELNK